MKVQRWAMAAAVAAAIFSFALPVVSQERDSDGTRMQARHIELGTVETKTLNPPDESADWRMLRLDEETGVELTLSVDTADRRATLTLTGATGEELEVKTAQDDPATIERTLLAGIYFISVESSDPLQYELSVQ